MHFILKLLFLFKTRPFSLQFSLKTDSLYLESFSINNVKFYQFWLEITPHLFMTTTKRDCSTLYIVFIEFTIHQSEFKDLEELGY